MSNMHKLIYSPRYCTPWLARRGLFPSFSYHDSPLPIPRKSLWFEKCNWYQFCSLGGEKGGKFDIKSTSTSSHVNLHAKGSVGIRVIRDTLGLIRDHVYSCTAEFHIPIHEVPTTFKMAAALKVKFPWKELIEICQFLTLKIVKRCRMSTIRIRLVSFIDFNFIGPYFTFTSESGRICNWYMVYFTFVRSVTLL